MPFLVLEGPWKPIVCQLCTQVYRFGGKGVRGKQDESGFESINNPVNPPSTCVAPLVTCIGWVWEGEGRGVVRGETGHWNVHW